MRGVTNNVVLRGRTLSVSYKGTSVAFEFENKKDAAFVADLPGLCYHKQGDCLQANDNGKITTVVSILKARAITESTSSSEHRGKKCRVGDAELLEAMATALRSKSPVKTLSKITGYAEFTSATLLGKLSVLRSSFSQEV
jgi:hypothetical protein